MSDTNSPQDWDALAERVARHVDNYLSGLEAVARGNGGARTIPLLLLEVSQVILAGAQLGASANVILPDNSEPEVGDDPDLDAIRQGLNERLVGLDEYVEVFDPYKDTEPTSYRLSDDLVDVASGLVTGCATTSRAVPWKPSGGGSTPTSTTGATTPARPCGPCTRTSPTPAWTSPRSPRRRSRPPSRSRRARPSPPRSARPPSRRPGRAARPRPRPTRTRRGSRPRRSWRP